MGGCQERRGITGTTARTDSTENVWVPNTKGKDVKSSLGVTGKLPGWSVLSHSVLSDSWWPQVPLSMQFSRQGYWGGLLCPPPGELPKPGTEPRSPTLWVASSLSESPGKPGWSVRKVTSPAPTSGRTVCILGSSPLAQNSAWEEHGRLPNLLSGKWRGGRFPWSTWQPLTNRLVKLP